MKWLLIALAVLAAVYIVHRTLTYAETSGWIFYRNRPRVQFLGFLEELVEPRVEYLIEEESSQRTTADQAESGEGPFLQSDLDPTDG